MLHFGGSGGKSTSKFNEKYKDFQVRNFRKNDTNGVFGRSSCVLPRHWLVLILGLVKQKVLSVFILS